MKKRRILFYGFGNPGRADDGIGHEFLELLDRALQKADPIFASENDWEFDSNYQLNIEDSERISHFDLVIFIDASMDESIDVFRFEKLNSDHIVQFTTHAASPAYIAHLAREVFSSEPDIYLLSIKGEHWEFGEVMGEVARRRMEIALPSILGFLSPTKI